MLVIKYDGFFFFVFLFELKSLLFIYVNTNNNLNHNNAFNIYHQQLRNSNGIYFFFNPCLIILFFQISFIVYITVESCLVYYAHRVNYKQRPIINDKSLRRL